MEIRHNDEYQHLLDDPASVRCPHCSVLSAMIPVSIPRYHLVRRFNLRTVGIVYRCSSCNGPAFFQYNVLSLSNPITLYSNFHVVNMGLEPFDMQYLSGLVLADFQEALTCYATSSWNAFAAMCRRCIQSISTSLGADGSTKVQAQLQDLKEMGIADDETFEQLRQIMLSGHDGAHPHLPALSPERAGVLLHLMKDVLYQLFVRPAKIREASELRTRAISN